MRTEHAPTIRRSDYRPLAWVVATVDLHFSLDPAATVVRNRMQVVRNAGTAAGPLRLFAEGLEQLELTVDGAAPAPGALRQTAEGLELDLAGECAVIEVVSRIAPEKNTTLSGLYCSRGGFFTQCEAEGFRRITAFPDRPDVMARFSVTLEADRATCPVLLANGNLVEQGELPHGRHYAKWHDPFLKPSYLFALVAAPLVCLERKIETMSGREVLLQVWVEDGQLDRTPHAMDSLVHALRWDEEKFGLELDLDRFMIVAVSDFNMGAMENKGLNIFNSKYVLAKPDTATDVDYEGIESVVAHEYLHNWTGNRVTCRDWFQLTLKEGLTVFRDQQFSADMMAAAAADVANAAAAAESARAVVRIDNVRVLRAAQFPEDAGPMAHPIRPDSYQEINNFYTATVYEKGSEVIRMLRTLLGEEGFRSGMDLYFEYHDGQAVTCDDFVAAMADASGRNLDQFMRWYSQAGTPRLGATSVFDAAARTWTLTLRQAQTGPGPGEPLHMPVAVGLIGRDGADLPLRLAGEVGGRVPTTRLLELTAAEQTWTFSEVPADAVPSLLRGFSAPVNLDFAETDATLAFRMAHDSDPFNRWDAAQRYFERVILGATPEAVAAGRVADDDFIAAYRRLLGDSALDPAFRALTLALPAEPTLLEAMRPADPQRLRATLMALLRQLGTTLRDDWLRTCDANAVPGPYRYHPADAGRRALRNLALRCLCAAGEAEGYARAEAQFAAAANMTERMGALAALVQSRAPGRAAALARFEATFGDDALVMDKWFALQAGAWHWGDGASTMLARVRELMGHPAFAISNPNKVYSLLGSFFRANPGEFHDAAGAGYAFWVEQVAALDALNPQVASRMARALERWQHFAPAVQARIRAALAQLAARPELSSDVREIVDKARG